MPLFFKKNGQKGDAAKVDAVKSTAEKTASAGASAEDAASVKATVEAAFAEAASAERVPSTRVGRAEAKRAAQLTAKDAAPELTFADLGLSEQVLAAVADMGYTAPTPVQAAAIPEALDGRDVLAAAQTGTGKTAAFLLPTMNNLPHVPRSRTRGRNAAPQGPLMLVVTPTRELAQQIEEVCTAIAKRTGHTSVTVVGGVSYNPQRDKLKRGCDILIATPGRLQDLIDQGACMLDQVQVLVLDEADRMLDMGFLPAVRRIVGYTPADRQTMLFSATLDESQVGSITSLVSDDPARIEIAPVTSTADTVDQYVLPVSPEAKNGLLADVLKREGAKRVIVFTRTKHRADACSRRLARSGFTTAAIHGDRSQAQRERALKAFRAGQCDVLVATDVLARGIDISDVSYVINFDVPEEPTDYIHRIGRTGRGGEVGWSLTFVTPDDVAEFFDIEALMGKTVELFDAAGLEVGPHPPVVDSDRVPAKAPAGKKEKQRRRKARKAATGARRGRGAEDGADGRAPSRSKTAGENATAEKKPAEKSAAEEFASKPARRKRSGRTRVRGGEGADLELLSAREVRAERENAARELRGEGRGGRKRSGRSRNEERSGSRRQDSRSDRRSSRGGSGREASSSREAWRNYDEPTGRNRNGRGGQGRPAGGHEVRTNNSPRRGVRRPGDKGGRR